MFGQRIAIFALVLIVAAAKENIFDFTFPKGTKFSVSVALGEFLPKKLAPGFAQIIEMDFLYPLSASNPKEVQRNYLRKQLEDTVTRMGYDGFECVVRFQCELESVPRPSSVLEDLLLLLFRGRRVDCRRSNCPFSLLQMIVHAERLDEFSFNDTKN